MSDSGAPPPDPAFEALSFGLRDTFLNAALVEVFMGGLYTMLFGYTISLISSRPKFFRANVTLMFFVGFMYILIMLHMCLQWLLTRQVWISAGATEITSFAALADQAMWQHTTSSVVNTTATLIADGILIWRVWVIWAKNWRIIVVPVLALIAEIVTAVFALIALARPLSADVTGDPSAIYLGLSLATTVLCTLLIVYRIVRLGTFSASSPYKNVIEIICESAALYSIALIIFLPMYCSKDVAINFPSEYLKRIVLGITGIAPTLIVARVAGGVGRSTEAWTEAASSFRVTTGGSTSRTQIGTTSTGVFVTRKVDQESMFYADKV